MCWPGIVACSGASTGAMSWRRLWCNSSPAEVGRTFLELTKARLGWPGFFAFPEACGGGSVFASDRRPDRDKCQKIDPLPTRSADFLLGSTVACPVLHTVREALKGLSPLPVILAFETPVR